MTVASQSIFHIAFSTFNQEEVITKNGQRILFKYIWELLKKRNCDLYRINGTSNHLHLAIQLDPLVPLDGLVKDIQNSTTTFISESRIFPDFAGWQEGYYAFSISYSNKAKLIEFIKSQEEIHSSISFEKEMTKEIKANGLGE
jgi:putative transposase